MKLSVTRCFRNQNGQSMVEYAIMIGVIVAVLVGITAFGDIGTAIKSKINVAVQTITGGESSSGGSGNSGNNGNNGNNGDNGNHGEGNNGNNDNSNTGVNNGNNK